MLVHFDIFVSVARFLAELHTRQRWEHMEPRTARTANLIMGTPRNNIKKTKMANLMRNVIQPVQNLCLGDSNQ